VITFDEDGYLNCPDCNRKYTTIISFNKHRKGCKEATTISSNPNYHLNNNDRVQASTATDTTFKKRRIDDKTTFDVGNIAGEST
jgi:hypothetical protein